MEVGGEGDYIPINNKNKKVYFIIVSDQGRENETDN